MRPATNRAFGLIELLLVLLAVSALVVISAKTLKKKLSDTKDGMSGLDLRQIFRNEIESEPDTRITEAGLDHFSFKNSTGTGSFRLSGELPGGVIEKEFTDSHGDQQNHNIMENVASLRFTYYRENGRLLIDDDAFSSPEKIKRIQVIIRTHNGNEENYFINDGIRGIDLDGDKSNGVARLKETSFLIDLKGG